MSSWPVMSGTSAIANIDEHCDRLLRDASARAVMVINEEGAILGHAGAMATLPDSIIDAAGDLVADCLGAGRRGELQEGDDLVAEAEQLSACAAPLGQKAVLVVVFDATSTLALVRLRMKRARDLLLRSLSEP